MTRPAALNWRAPRGRPFILGHRGARVRAPENTLAAFQLAVDEGADGVELDVRLSGDCEVVVLHDRTLERVTEGADTRDVEQVSRGDLDSVRLPDGGRIPRLSAVLDWAAQAGTRVNIEIKEDVTRRDLLVRRVAALARKVPDAPERLLLSSLHPGVLAQLALRAPEVALAWVISPELQPLWGEALWPGLGPVATHPHHSLATKARIGATHRRGAALNVWTVNDGEYARELLERGVDGIITDDPAAIVAALR